MASKGPEAFRTISEVAHDLDLPQHVLRFWETRFSQIRPMKRGGGRRYYRPDDIELLRSIRHLLYGEGYTIRGVQRILREQGPRFVVSAARGEMLGLEMSAEDDDEPEIAAASAVMDANSDDDGQEDADDAGLEPAFDPREFRPHPAGASANGGGGSGLTADDVRRLQSTLSDLLELKRLLDQAAG